MDGEEALRYGPSMAIRNEIKKLTNNHQILLLFVLQVVF